MTDWRNEIDKLESKRIEFGLNFNELEKHTGIHRGVLQRFFNKNNEPKVGFYFRVRDFLNEYCDCKLENGILKRGKVKCVKSKSEHKF